ncbi:hypothetical protein MNBD_ALPHA06-274 [hydrothermal vent metagenome]|uniref:Phosphoesterase HXTX domain-containing protein n=1 Tax=hydrothermal vent metagenome TaxID=652676 RepID=A0A3B0S654_9ZZZZ
MRLFTALAISEPAKHQLQMLQAGVPGAHWRPRENFHITLQFYGDIAPQAVSELEAALAEITVPVLELKLSGLGAFGKKHPFALWAGVAGATPMEQENLLQLAQNCYQAARLAGLSPEKRNYTPHLTLAYCTGVTNIQAANYFQQFDGYAPIFLRSSGFDLLSSHLGKGPAKYRVQTSFTPAK